jgi:hypothetical protein
VLAAEQHYAKGRMDGYWKLRRRNWNVGMDSLMQRGTDLPSSQLDSARGDLSRWRVQTESEG